MTGTNSANYSFCSELNLLNYHATRVESHLSETGSKKEEHLFLKLKPFYLVNLSY